MASRLNPNVADASVEGFAPIMALAAEPGFINLAPAQHCRSPDPHVLEAIRAAVTPERLRYGPSAGELLLREAIADKLRRRNGIDADPLNEIRVTHGAGHAFLMTLMTFLAPRDEVLVADPAFPLDRYTSELLGARAVPCALEPTAELPDRLEDAVTARTKAIVLHPVNNPTGCVLDRRTVERIAEVALRHDLLVLSDEVYEWFTYDGTANVSIASLDGMKERTVSIYSVSKEYNLPGLRVGYLVTSPEINRAIGKVQSNGPVGASVIGQYGALAALSGPQQGLEAFVAELAGTRRRVVERLNAMPYVRCALQSGGFFVFPDLGVPTDELVLGLAERASVGVAAGSWYGERGRTHVRICYGSAPPAVVDEALDRLEGFLRGS